MIAPTFVHDVFPTNAPLLVNLNSGASGVGTVCVSAVDRVAGGYTCFVRFGRDSTTQVSSGDFEMKGNDICRFSFGPSSRYMSLMLSAPSATFEVSYYIEGRNSG